MQAMFHVKQKIFFVIVSCETIFTIKQPCAIRFSVLGCKIKDKLQNYITCCFDIILILKILRKLQEDNLFALAVSKVISFNKNKQQKLSQKKISERIRQIKVRICYFSLKKLCYNKDK